jgi:hypothetical protein
MDQARSRALWITHASLAARLLRFRSSPSAAGLAAAAAFHANASQLTRSPAFRHMLQVNPDPLPGLQVIGQPRLRSVVA